MTVSSIPHLLVDCLHDLADGQRQLADRLGTIAESADEASLRQMFQLIGSEGRILAGELHAACEALEPAEPDAPNIWMQGILDDAERDTEMIVRGRLLDIALVGAIQKALASCDVSFDTALAVAAECGNDEIGETLERAQRGTRRNRDRLRSFLDQLSGA